VAFTSSLVWPGALLHAQVPQLVNYQGRVAVGSENPVNFNGTGSFKFALVNTVSAPVPTTTSLWSNNGSSVAGSEPTLAVSLAVTKGLYSVLLGDTTVPGMTLAIPASVWLHADVRLRVWFNDGINGSQLLTPDQRLAPHGYLPDGSVSSTKLAPGLTLAGTTTGTFSGSLSGNATTATAAGTTTNFSGALTGHVTGTQGATVVASVGGVNAANVGSGAILANAATPANTATTLVKRDASGNFAAGTITGSLSGNATTATSTPNFSGNLAGNVTGPQGATVVASVGGVTAANVAAGANLANAATPTNTANTLVKRDASGNFAAGTITGTFSGSGAGLTNIPGSALSSSLSLSGTLNLPATTSSTVGVMTQNGTQLLHTFGAGNFFAGPNAGNFTMSGGSNTGTGNGALFSNTTGTGNTASGTSALFSNTTGNGNTASGDGTLPNNTTGFFNTAIGQYALQMNTTGTNNTASGAGALRNNTTGYFNTANGSAALNSNTTGHSNVASGVLTLSNNTTGGQNTAIGNSALSSSTTGFSNTAIGFSALENNTTGGQNIALGLQAGRNLTTGSYNIAIGNAGVAAESGIIRIGTNGTHTDTYLAGGIHLGSGTGTSEPPDKPLVIRRTRSTSQAAGQVVAKTDNLTLERDGTSSGLRISYIAVPGLNIIAFTGLSATGATVNFVTSLANPATAGTVTVYTNAQDLISIRGSFGNTYTPAELTEVSLTRHPGDNYWIGTITSTFNQ